MLRKNKLKELEKQSDKMQFKTKKMPLRDKGEEHVLIKEVTEQDITIINMYVSKKTAKKYIK